MNSQVYKRSFLHLADHHSLLVVTDNTFSPSLHASTMKLFNGIYLRFHGMRIQTRWNWIVTW